jgi:branched-chain amino acid transport system substrate-binding protein
MGDAGIGRVIAVADWLPNVDTAGSENFYKAFRGRYPLPAHDYVHLRMQLMVEALAQAIEAASQQGTPGNRGAMDIVAVGAQLERASVTMAGQTGSMRMVDHQFQQPLMVGVMDRLGMPGVKFDVEGSGYGFRVVKTLTAAAAEMPTVCKMLRP